MAERGFRIKFESFSIPRTQSTSAHSPLFEMPSGGERNVMKYDSRFIFGFLFSISRSCFVMPRVESNSLDRSTQAKMSEGILFPFESK